MNKWEPLIPDTDIPRLEFLAFLIRMHRNPLAHIPMERVELIQQTAEWGVLSNTQIAALFDCSPTLVRRVLAAKKIKSQSSRGKLDPGCLEMLHVTAVHFARGQRPSPKRIRDLSEYCSGFMLEKLVGIPRRTYTRYRSANA